MKKISNYGNYVINNFIDYAQELKLYDRLFKFNNLDHTDVLETCIRNEEDFVAWCLLKHGTKAIEFVELERDTEHRVVMWRNRKRRFSLNYGRVIRILNMCLKEKVDNPLKIKDLKYMLPKYSDNSGYDCQIIYNNPRHALFLCKHELYNPLEKPEQNELEVETILPGLTRTGGDYDYTLAIVVEAKEF